jgi:hypothetical protein
MPGCTIPVWTAATLPLPVMGQIPHIPRFTGEGRATGDSFAEWLEHSRSLRERLIGEVHGGRFGAHLSDVKVYGELRKHYWWPGMREYVTQWTRACLTCATHQPGRKVKLPLTPIPVAGAFDRVGVDVLQLPRTRKGNRYAVVFVDYLTKWPEVFAVADQSSATIVKLLEEEVISRHGVPAQILSDRGPNLSFWNNEGGRNTNGVPQTEHDSLPPPD